MACCHLQLAFSAVWKSMTSPLPGPPDRPSVFCYHQMFPRQQGKGAGILATTNNEQPFHHHFSSTFLINTDNAYLSVRPAQTISCTLAESSSGRQAGRLCQPQHALYASNQMLIERPYSEQQHQASPSRQSQQTLTQAARFGDYLSR